MKASLDTNVIIHLYSTNNQELLFKMFDEEIYIDGFIYDVELQNHGQDILSALMDDIAKEKIKIVREEDLKAIGIWHLYRENFEEEKTFYSPSDMGEAHVIALARTLGAVSVVTDDTKDYGPHYYLMRIEGSLNIPFAFYEILILLYLKGDYSAKQVINIFNSVIKTYPEGEMAYELKPKINQFVRRFAEGRYSIRDKKWFEAICKDRNIRYRAKLKELVNLL